VEHAGQLVTKDALFAAVWPETIVSETALTNCIGELRRALQDEPRQPRFIETVHRRGYRFLLTVTTPPVQSLKFQVQSSTPLLAVSSPPEAAPFSQLGTLNLKPETLLVGRDVELTQLHALFAKALNGERQMVFVTGEAGIGKTALVDTFVQSLGSRVTKGPESRVKTSLESAVRGPQSEPIPNPQSLTPGWWVAWGQCIEQYGSGEAYLPVLEALGRLGRGPQKEALLAVLHQYAPTWLVQLPALVSPAELEAVQRRIQGATRERMLREISEALDVFAAAHPVVLVLEDLHWSDPSTVELLAALGRRRESARLLVIGTYRAAELVVTNHPLRTAKQELVARKQAVEVALELLSPAAVRDYVSQRVAETGVADTLGDVIYRRTDGQPLFMVQVTDYIVQQGGNAAPLPTDLTAVEQTLPQDLREAIEAQLRYLSDEEQTVLASGSVSGAEFTVASIAAGLGSSEVEIETICDALVQRGQFIAEREVEMWPDGTLSGRYTFRHALYQEVLYQRVSGSRQVRMHRAIGERLERGYRERAQEIAAELAMHFERGHDAQRAVSYLKTAADTALRRHAYVEAIRLLSHALALLPAWPDTPARVEQELTLQFALGAPLVATKGYTAPEVAYAYTRARELCRQLGDTPQLFSPLLGLTGFHFARAEFSTARELAELCLTQAQRDPNPTRLMWAHYALGQVLCCAGEFTRAKDHLEQGLVLYQPQEHRRFVARGVQDPYVSCLCFLALSLWFLGFATQAVATIQRAQDHAHAMGHPFSVTRALDYAARVYQYCREQHTAQEKAETLLAVAREHGFIHYLPGGEIRHGWRLTEQGHYDSGLPRMRHGLATYQATVAELERPYYLTLLAEAYGKSGQLQEGLAIVDEAMTIIGRSGERFYEAELWRIKGELLLNAERGTRNDERRTPKEECDASSIHHSSFIIHRSSFRRGRSLFPESHCHCPPTTSQVAGVTCSDEPRAVATTTSPRAGSREQGAGDKERNCWKARKPGSGEARITFERPSVPAFQRPPCGSTQDVI